MINHISALSSSPINAAFKSFDAEFNSFTAPGLQLDPTQGVSQPSFGDLLGNALGSVGDSEHKAEKLAFDFATGKPVDIHTMMIAEAQASVLVQATSTVVSKTATSINQLLQTQI